jgi:hypothetical protein
MKRDIADDAERRPEIRRAEFPNPSPSCDSTFYQLFLRRGKSWEIIASMSESSNSSATRSPTSFSPIL